MCVWLQLRRHQVEVSRLQETAAADRRAFEQQLAAAQRVSAQLRQQDQARQQEVEELEQQAQDLQRQLAQQQAVSEDLQQALHAHEQQQQQHPGGAEDDLVQQLAAADAELQQLREQLAEAEDEIAALAQQLQEQQAQADFSGSAQGYDPEGIAEDGSSPHAPAAVVHALRAELGMANAEVARLRHQLDVASASQQQERELTGHEILRLQQELSETATSGSGEAAAAGDAAADEVTSRPVTNRLDSRPGSSNSWHSVHGNPAFEQQQQQQGQGNVMASGLAAADSAGAAAKLSRYESKLQDQAETISSLQRQLKQQEQLLAAMQKRERRVSAVTAADTSKTTNSQEVTVTQGTQHLSRPGNMRFLPVGAWQVQSTYFCLLNLTCFFVLCAVSCL
jgi:predicted  nucleic acid-binding Zn-ribbon protein